MNDNKRFFEESIAFGNNPNLPNTSTNNLTGNKYITDELLNSFNIYSKKDIEEARFNKFTRFGRLLDPYGRINSGREYLFFVKPDLHIVIPYGKDLNSDIYKQSNSIKAFAEGTENTINGLTLNPQLSNNPYFRDLLDKHPEVIKELQYSADPTNNPFSHLLSFSVSSYLDMASVSAETLDNPSTIYGTSYKYLRDFEASDENNTFNLEFVDDKNLNTYHFFKAYSEYHNARKSGLITPPDLNYYRYKRLHNVMGIYKFIVAEDAETLLYWAYFCGVYPTSCPREAFSDPEFNSGLTFSIPFESAFIEDMNPITLYQFNELMKPVMIRYGCNKNNWLPVVRQSHTPDSIIGFGTGFHSYDPSLGPSEEIRVGDLPVAALIDGRLVGNERPKYRLRWYAPSK